MGENIIHKDNLIHDFIDVTKDVLSTMASYHVEIKDVREINGGSDMLNVTACMDITGVLGFSGGRKGSILVTFSDRIALAAVGGMLGMTLTEINADVRDGIAELVNMIAGGAKTRLQKKGVNFDLSIPNTVIGANHQITAPAGTSRTRIDFVSDDGEFFIEVYLKEE